MNKKYRSEAFAAIHDILQSTQVCPKCRLSKVAQLNQQQGNKDRSQNAFERLLKLLHLKA